MTTVRRALTLIELLAATAILSAVAAAGAALTTDARLGAASAQRQLAALEALGRWRLRDTSRDEPWSWTDDEGAPWRMRVEALPPDAAPPAIEDDPRLVLVWSRLKLVRIDDGHERVMMTLLVCASPEDEP